MEGFVALDLPILGRHFFSLLIGHPLPEVL